MKSFSVQIKKLSMKYIIVITFLAIFSLNAASINKKHFYEVFKCESIDSVDNLLRIYEEIENPEAEVILFKGALYIKKSGFLKSLNEKLELFKIGREIVEKKIEEQPDNVEFRFVRLIIQDKVPAILRYHKNKEEDAEMVVKGISLLEKSVQEAIFDYAENSPSLAFE